MRPRCQDNRQRGVAAVELAFVIIFLLMLVAGIVEFGRAFWYYDALTKATRDGARLLSMAQRDTFTAAIDAAKDRVVASANAANLQPALTSADVSVTCMSQDFSSIGCDNGNNAPHNVRVAIDGYTIDIGGMIPFLSPTGGAAKTYRDVTLAPQTTMRFMNREPS